MTSALIQSFKNLFKKPATIPYPFAPTYKPKDFRGLIKYNEEKCIFCLKCESVCPPQSIIFDQSIDDGKYKYHYNPYLCIYCGECVRACPEPGHDGALWQDEEAAKVVANKVSQVNDDWFALEKRAESNKERWKEVKKERKAQEEAKNLEEKLEEHKLSESENSDQPKE